jgi:hypothetical protein
LPLQVCDAQMIDPSNLGDILVRTAQLLCIGKLSHPSKIYHSAEKIRYSTRWITMEISTSTPVLLETSYVGPKKTMHYSQTKTEWGCQQWSEELRRAVTCLIYRSNTHIRIKLHRCIIKMIIPSKEHELLQELTWAVTCLSEKMQNWHLFCVTGTPQYRQRGKEMPWYMQWQY